MSSPGQETFALADLERSKTTDDLLGRGVERLSNVALVVIGAWGVGLAFNAVQVFGFGGSTWPVPDAVVAILTGVMSAAYVIAARLSRLPLAATATLGVAYVFAVPLVFAFAGVAVPWWTQGVPYLGVPWFCLWILLVPIIVPARFGATVITTLALTLIGPLALLTGPPLMGVPTAPFQAYVDLFLPSLVAGFMAVMSARVVHELGQATREARSVADRALRMGSYRLDALLGSGGMGEVWLAEHQLLVRPAAVKLIRKGRDHDGAMIARFEREARAIAALRSPHTVELYDFGATEDGAFYYAMELLDGADLGEIVADFGPMPVSRAVHVLVQICDSLAEAHHHGLVHRDIKPGNLFLCRLGLTFDVVKVLDFGLVRDVARPAAGEAFATRAHVILGTPATMAPEQAAGGEGIDHRADLYSLGCVAFWLVTGRHVFEGATAMDLISAHLRDPAPRPSQVTTAALPDGYDEIVARCLAKRPDDRFPSALAIRDALLALPLDPPWTQADAEAWWARHEDAFSMPEGSSATTVDVSRASRLIRRRL